MLLAQQYTFRDGKLAESRSAAGWLDAPALEEWGRLRAGPSNRLQGMRGRACFRPDERLARRSRIRDPWVVRPLDEHRGSRSDRSTSSLRTGPAPLTLCR